MRTLKTFFLFILAAVLLFSCDSAGNEYFFENPVAVSVVKNVKCVNGSVSYIGFVVDNTEKYGARIMKISGCGLKIDKGFKDQVDDKTGLYIGGTGVDIDQIVVDNDVIIATLSSGTVEYENPKNDEKKLEDHRGRVVLRKLVDNFDHDDSFDKSVLLDFHPLHIKGDGEGFVVYGTYFGKNMVAYVGTDGSLKTHELDFHVSDMVLSNGKVVLFDGNNSLFTIDKELVLSSVWTGEIDSNSNYSGISELSKGRTALYYDTHIIILDHNFGIVEKIELPELYNVTSVSSASYNDEFLYRSFPKEMMNEKGVIYERSIDDEDVINDSDVEIPDTDEESTDTDAAIIYAALDDTDIVEDNDTEIADNDTEVADNEISDEDVVSGPVVLDAKDGDILWIATSTGSVLAYDIKNSSWMVTYYTEDQKEDTSDYYLEMRPYLDSTFTSYPENGATGFDNAPFIKKISVARGLSQAYTYNLTYEGIIEGSRSMTGTFDEDAMILSDENAKFQDQNYDIVYDKVLLLNKKSNSECLIPLNTNITMDMVSVDSQTQINVDVEDFADSLSSCYGDFFSYGIYPKEKYAVSRENFTGKYFTGRADELSADAGESEVSYSDELVDISIQRKSDDVSTSKETVYYLKVNPGVPYIGLSSNDLIVNMIETVPGKLIMFSPLTRRMVEYDVENRDVVEIYK